MFLNSKTLCSFSYQEFQFMSIDFKNILFYGKIGIIL